ncbi:hypothetical protein MRB53_016587 [Persea americana]|uniref:Uncharacterized protein n=1 Tax=Persea americana TaxID=3435 RepID=A0ACC2M2J7_PERAE|nr:hypothetical protein MRB53_016587 [Persea americana]
MPLCGRNDFGAKQGGSTSETVRCSRSDRYGMLRRKLHSILDHTSSEIHVYNNIFRYGVGSGGKPSTILCRCRVLLDRLFLGALHLKVTFPLSETALDTASKRGR